MIAPKQTHGEVPGSSLDATLRPRRLRGIGDARGTSLGFRRPFAPSMRTWRRRCCRVSLAPSQGRQCHAGRHWRRRSMRAACERESAAAQLRERVVDMCAKGFSWPRQFLVKAPARTWHLPLPPRQRAVPPARVRDQSLSALECQPLSRRRPRDGNDSLARLSLVRSAARTTRLSGATCPSDSLGRVVLTCRRSRREPPAAPSEGSTRESRHVGRPPRANDGRLNERSCALSPRRCFCNLQISTRLRLAVAGGEGAAGTGLQEKPRPGDGRLL